MDAGVAAVTCVCVFFSCSVHSVHAVWCIPLGSRSAFGAILYVAYCMAAGGSLMCIVNIIIIYINFVYLSLAQQRGQQQVALSACDIVVSVGCERPTD